MLPSTRELDSRKSDDSATKLDFLTQNAPQSRPKAPQDAPRAPQELPESSPSAPPRVPGSSREHSWRSQIAPKSSTSLKMILLELKRLPPKASGPSLGAFSAHYWFTSGHNSLRSCPRFFFCRGCHHSIKSAKSWQIEPRPSFLNCLCFFSTSGSYID